MTEVTYSLSHVTGSVSHTQKNTHCPTISVSVSPQHHPGSHKLFSPLSTGHNCQSYCPMSRLFPVVVLRVLSHCLFFQGFPVVRVPIRPSPAWDTQPKAQGPASRNPGPLRPPHSGWTCTIFPCSVNRDLCVPELVLAPLKGPLGPAPLPGCPGLCFPGEALLGSQEEADYIV